MSEMRLIDANALEKVLNAKVRTLADVNGRYNHYVSGFDDAITYVEDAPTIDAVPVVRCGECKKFWEYTESHKATVEKADGDCMIRCMVAPDDPQFCAVQKDDYCSMGVRMDGQATTAPTKSDRGCSTCANDGMDMPQCRECTEHPGYPWYKRRDGGDSDGSD